MPHGMVLTAHENRVTDRDKKRSAMPAGLGRKNLAVFTKQVETKNKEHENTYRYLECTKLCTIMYDHSTAACFPEIILLGIFLTTT